MSDERGEVCADVAEEADERLELVGLALLQLEDG